MLLFAFASSVLFLGASAVPMQGVKSSDDSGASYSLSFGTAPRASRRLIRSEVKSDRKFRNEAGSEDQSLRDDATAASPVVNDIATKRSVDTVPPARTYKINWKSGYGHKGIIRYVVASDAKPLTVDLLTFNCRSKSALSGTRFHAAASFCKDKYRLKIRVLRRTDTAEIIGTGSCCNTGNVVTGFSFGCPGPTTTQANSCTVTGVDHKSGTTGKYFNFDKPGGWTSGQAVSVNQCRSGQSIWSGKIMWWAGVNGGSTGNSHGRRNTGTGSGQWQVGDIVTDGACQAPIHLYVTGCTNSSWNGDYSPQAGKRLDPHKRRAYWQKDQPHQLYYYDFKWRFGVGGSSVAVLATSSPCPTSPTSATFEHGCTVADSLKAEGMLVYIRSSGGAYFDWGNGNTDGLTLKASATSTSKWMWVQQSATEHTIQPANGSPVKKYLTRNKNQVILSESNGRRSKWTSVGVGEDAAVSLKANNGQYLSSNGEQDTSLDGPIVMNGIRRIFPTRPECSQTGRLCPLTWELVLTD